MPAPTAPPPSYQQAIAGMPDPQHMQMPAQFFDFSSIPQTNVLFPQNCPPLLNGPSSIPIKTEGNEVFAFSSVLDHNPDELWRFFMSHIDKPGLVIAIRGWHREWRTRVVQRDGRTEIERYEEDVTDFHFHLDAGAYVSPAWSRMVCMPRPGQVPQSYRTTIEEYTRSRNILKEIHLVKQPLWDYDNLTRAIQFCIRQTGYPHFISVNYTMPNSQISVFCDHPLSRVAHNTCMRILCVLTCLCIIFAPIYFLSRKKTSNKLIVEYPMMISSSDFFARNYSFIQSHVWCGRINTAMLMVL
eukprot:jgi/Hompol1/7081/HPOL_005186-RA